MKARSLVIALTAILFVGLGAYYSFQHHAPHPRASDVLYESQLATVPDETLHALSRYRGKPLLVNFWATWCAPCVQEMPELSTLQAELSTNQIQFIGIGIDNIENMSEFAKKYKITYPLFVGGMSGTQLSKILGNDTGGLPFTVLLNASGDIVKTYRGRLDIKQVHSDILANM